MPEHVHLFLSEPKAMPLATTLSVLKGESSKVLKGERTQFWQTRYYDLNVLTHKKHVEKLRYMHRNPVARGLVEKSEDWPWSSFNHYATDKRGRVKIESEWTWNRRERELTPPIAILPR
jgi:putative transposase